MKSLFKNPPLFLLLYALFFVVSLVIVLTYSKIEQMRWINEHYTPLLDIFFKTITWLGEGALFVMAIIGLFIWRKNWAWAALFSFASSTLLAQFFKHYIFPNNLRPITYFAGNTHWHFVQGIEIHHFNSFPSGHTASAFALFSLAAFFLKDKRSDILCLILAILVGYSRAYLFQHFPEDILAGSFLGLICSIFALRFVKSKSQ